MFQECRDLTEHHTHFSPLSSQLNTSFGLYDISADHAVDNHSIQGMYIHFNHFFSPFILRKGGCVCVCVASWDKSTEN